MERTVKLNVSDWIVMFLGSIGFLLGLAGLINPQSQYSAAGLNASSITKDSIVPALFGSVSLSAIYVGLMYIFGVLKGWKNFKGYLIFARSIMAIGFVTLVLLGKAPGIYISAAIWEAAGAVIILLSIWWDVRKK